jgi:Protein of unknown function (DUF998)
VKRNQPKTGIFWPVVGILAVLTYNTWILWQPLNGNPKILDGYLSELSASNQPNNLFFRVGDFLTALLVGAMGVHGFELAYRALPRRSRWWAVAGASVLLFSACTLFDSIFAMDCSPTLSSQCKLLEDTGALTPVHYAHTFTSVGAQIGIVASMIAAYLAIVQEHQRRIILRRLLLGICSVEVIALSIMMIMLADGASGLAYPQMVMVLAASLWFCLAGIGLGRAARPRSRTNREDDIRQSEEESNDEFV